MPKREQAVFVDYKLGEGQLENPLMWQNFEALPTGGFARAQKAGLSALPVTLSGRYFL